MTTLDWVTIALYFGLLAGLTWWAVSRNRNTADDDFLAGRDLGWVVVGASIFASNIGGMRAVAYTEAVQTAVFIAGSLMLMVVGLNRLGGWSELRAVLGSDMFNLWKPITPAGIDSTWLPVIIALAWIPVIQGARGLYDYLQGSQAYLAPPVAAVFFFGVLMRRLTAAGCLAALLTGFRLGMLRLFVDTPVTIGMAGYQNGYTPGSWLWILK